MFFFFFLVHVGRKLPLKRNTRPGDRIIHQSERNLPLSLNVTRSSKLSPKKSQLQLHEVKQLQETSNPFSCIFSESEWAWDSCPRRQLSVFWHSLDVDFLKKKKKKAVSDRKHPPEVDGLIRRQLSSALSRNIRVVKPDFCGGVSFVTVNEASWDPPEIWCFTSTSSAPADGLGRDLSGGRSPFETARPDT